MGTLIIHIDSSVSKSKVKEELKKVKGIISISDKITLSDFEAMADNSLVNEMKKADKGSMLSYDDGKKEFEKIKKSLRK